MQGDTQAGDSVLSVGMGFLLQRPYQNKDATVSAMLIAKAIN